MREINLQSSETYQFTKIGNTSLLSKAGCFIITMIDYLGLSHEFKESIVDHLKYPFMKVYERRLHFYFN